MTNPPKWTHRWWRERARYLQANPECLGCRAVGKQAPATVVDHIVPHQGDEGRFWNVANWQSACQWHHDAIKQRLEREYLLGKLKVEALSLASPEAIALTQRHQRAQIGLDGWPIEEKFR